MQINSIREIQELERVSMMYISDVIHTVGPRGEKPKLLRSCYDSCLQKMLKLQQKTIVSTSYKCRN